MNQHGLPFDKEMFHLLAFTGMRPGEMIALKETDFFFDTNQLRITKTLYNRITIILNMSLLHQKQLVQSDNRRGSSNHETYKRHITEQKKLRMTVHNFNPNYHDEKFVFCNDDGYPIIQKTVIRRMERLIRKTSISKRQHLISFDTHISMMAEADVDLKTVMKRVGHDDPKTTLQVYTHVTEKMREKSMSKMNIQFADILAGLSSQGM